MGKVEKVVVLSVLFLITVILVISLSSPFEALGSARPPAADEAARMLPPPGGEAQPAGSATLAAAGEPEPIASVEPVTAEPEVAQQPAAQAPPLALHSEVTTTVPAPQANAILITTEGLLPSFRPDYRFYEWKAGDTWRSIAARYYGDPGRARLLRHENEGRDQVQPGEKIFVPVVDLLAAASAPAPGGASAAPAGGQPAAAGTRGAYIVAEGDSLWRIAKRQYGDGSRWKEIYDANRDVLASPDALSAGQSLRIP